MVLGVVPKEADDHLSDMCPGQNQAGAQLPEGVHQTCAKVSQNIFLRGFPKDNLQGFSKYILQTAQYWLSGNVDRMKLMDQSHYVSTFNIATQQNHSRFGVDLVPTFSFGENWVYDQVVLE